MTSETHRGGIVMNVLLIGGPGSLTNRMIVKLKKEGHWVSLLTGESFARKGYEKVFETYSFTYDSDSLKEIFESVCPDCILFMGAYDTNFNWNESEREAVRFISAIMNILLCYSSEKNVRFVFLSSDEVFGKGNREDILEEEPVWGDAPKTTALIQAEQICREFSRNWGKDVVILRLDHLYQIPRNIGEALQNPCAELCMSALRANYISADKEKVYSLLYEDDAVEFIYEIIAAKHTEYALYHLSSGDPVSEWQMAQEIKKAMGNTHITVLEAKRAESCRRVLSNKRFAEEFPAKIYHSREEGVKKVVKYMKRNRAVFVDEAEEELSLGKRILQQFGWFLKAVFPFLENMVCFIPFFMLNNRTVGSQYFSRLDFYLFYVLLFAIVHGQHQALFSAVLAVCGYLFRQMYTRSGFEVMLDYTTYVWMAQLFILGLVVGYMRDQIRDIRQESAEIQDNLNRQLGDMKDINSSNVRVKDVLEQQVVDQKDSIGKIYSITSSLERYMPEEVLFHAVEIVRDLLNCPDVAIYTVHRSGYARMFSASSDEARKLGNSILYQDMTDMYEALKEQRVYINRNLDASYPLMANAIYDNEEMQMILMLWGLPWERMTLGEANRLVVVSYLIQNAVLRANRYLAALEERRYLADTKILEAEAFTSLVQAYYNAKKKNLTECTLLQIECDPATFKRSEEILLDNLRQTDYLGTMDDGKLYVLLSNTVKTEAQIVVNRFMKAGFSSRIIDRIER